MMHIFVVSNIVTPFPKKTSLVDGSCSGEIAVSMTGRQLPFLWICWRPGSTWMDNRCRMRSSRCMGWQESEELTQHGSFKTCRAAFNTWISVTNVLKALCKFSFQAASRHFFGFHFNRNLDRTTLPGGLQTLAFGNDSNQSLDGVTLPPGLQTLTFGNDFAFALVCMCVCVCVLCSQDLKKTAYVVEGDGLLPLLGRLQRELGAWPRGEWHISLWAAKTAEVFIKHIASKGRCVATVAVSVSDRGLNDGYNIRLLRARSCESLMRVVAPSGKRLVSCAVEPIENLYQK